MKKTVYMASALLLSGLAISESYARGAPLLNSVVYSVQAKQWVAANSAEVNVSVYATVKEQTVDVLQAEIIKKLRSLTAEADWHVLDLQMSQDRSGLQTLSWNVQARLSMQAVNLLKQKIEHISQAGQQYKIDSVRFTPTLAQMQDAQAQLRQEIYLQAKKELNVLNQDFSNTPYFLHDVNFISEQPAANSPVALYATKQAMPSQPAVGTELTLAATVTLAARTK